MTLTALAWPSDCPLRLFWQHHLLAALRRGTADPFSFLLALIFAGGCASRMLSPDAGRARLDRLIALLLRMDSVLLRFAARYEVRA